MSELGGVKLYFGKVKSVKDELKICRCQIAIPGHTDKLNSDDLPWYYPHYGRNYLPLVDDTVTVAIFDDNFSTGTYGRKINLEDAGVSEGDYENYLEIFKRQCANGMVELKYTDSKGIELINGKSELQIEDTVYSMFCEGNSIIMKKDKITIGSGTRERAINGESARELIQLISDNLDNYQKNLESLLETVKNAAMGSPYTMNIGGALSGTIPNLKILHDSNHSAEKEKYTEEVQISKMVEINK